jgi:hypothetical protein
MIKVIAAGKTIATFTGEDAYLASHRQARTLSLQNNDVPVYVQDGNVRSIYRNGYSL